MPWSARSGLMTQAMLPASSSQLPSAIWAAVASVYSQRPSLVMPTVSTSYFSRSMLLTKLPTETRLTSCSLDIPPNSSTTHIFSDCMITLSYLQSPRPGRDITGKMPFWLIIQYLCARCKQNAKKLPVGKRDIFQKNFPKIEDFRLTDGKVRGTMISPLLRGY